MTDDPTPANRALTKSTLLPAVIAAFVLLTLTGLAATLATYRANGAANYVAHTTEVRLTLQRLFSQVQDLRLAQRGYTATGSQAAIALFQETEAAIPTTLQYLTELTADNPSQGERITRLAPAISSFALQLRLSIENVARPRVDTPSQSSATMESGGQLSGIRAAIAEMDETERRLYSERQAVASRTQTLLLATIIGALALTAILGLLVSLTARRQMTELRTANAALAAEMQERNLIEAQLRQAQKMEAVGQLTGGIAHDFNNMLAVIVGSLDMLARRLQGSHPQYMELVRMAVNGADRASALTRRLLAFSRLQPLDPKPTDVNRCVGDLAADCAGNRARGWCVAHPDRSLST